MKKKITVLIAILMALSFVFLLAACNKDGKETTAAATTAAGETTAQSDTTGTDETTAAEATTLPGDTTAAGETTSAGTVKAPSTPAEIVTYYNAASNKAKADKPGFTLVTTNIIGKITSSSGLIQSVAGTVVGMFDTKPTTSTTAKGSNGDLPVQNQSYGSKLVPSSLKSAACVDKGSTYEITLKFNDEILSALPTDPTKTKHGQALNVLSASDISVQTDKFKAIVKVTEFAPTYTGSYIICTVDKATGNMKTATYFLNTQASVKAKLGFSVLDAAVPFGIKNEYTLNY